MPRKVPISLRIDARLKAAAETLCERENRSFTNLIETLILERCAKHGIQVNHPSKRGDSPAR